MERNSEAWYRRVHVLCNKQSRQNWAIQAKRSQRKWIWRFEGGIWTGRKIYQSETRIANSISADLFLNEGAILAVQVHFFVCNFTIPINLQILLIVWKKACGRRFIYEKTIKTGKKGKKRQSYDDNSVWSVKAHLTTLSNPKVMYEKNEYVGKMLQASSAWMGRLWWKCRFDSGRQCECFTPNSCFHLCDCGLSHFHNNCSHFIFICSICFVETLA